MNGLEAFLAPGIQLVGRLRFANKILAIGAVFCVPIAVLLYLYLAAQWTNSEFSAKERIGARMLVPVRAVLQPLQEQREAAQLALAGDATAKRRLIDSAARVESAFAAGDRVDREIGAELDTAPAWGQLRAAWGELKAKSAGMPAEASFAAHSALIRQLTDFILLIADNSNLTLDPDIDSYYLMDSSVVRLPVLAELLAQTGAVGAQLAARKDFSVASRAELLVNLQRLDEHVATLAGNFAKINKANPAVGTALAASDERARQALAPFVKLIRERIVDSPAGEVDAKTLLTLGDEATQVVWKLFDISTDQLDGVVAARVGRIYREVGLSMTLVAISLAAVAYLFISFRRSVVKSIGHLATGVDYLAAGQLGETLDSHSQDELREVVAGINGAMRTLSQVVEAQRELKAKHDAGDIDSRLDETRLTGAYAEVARQINALLDAHISVKFQFAGIMREYGEGDFSHDMPPLPGKKRQISDAAAEIKNSLQSLAAEIQTLATAANRGDFTVRGDESRFKHGFRDMVATLNQLAATSATGLNDVVRVLNAIANGDLTQRIEAHYEGTFGQLKDDANTTVERLREVVSQIKDAAGVINTAAQEINAGNSDLSGRTEEQASRLEETASSMEELTTTVKQNADSAREANDLARSSNEVANRGGDMVGRVIETMDAIQDSSRKIADIISVIDGIAFQTNILALNAAVEAARAGEQGRGFAVVATEVRSLAQRSATAAKEIKELIDSSSAKVDDGAKLVREAGMTMTEVVQSFQQVAGFVTQIANASVEQSAGIEQITQAVGAIDESTQQNAALVEEASNAAESLAVQARALVSAVAIFRLGNEKSAASPASAAPVERRGPNRAKNVSRLATGKRPAAPAVPATPTARAAAGAAGDNEWEEF